MEYRNELTKAMDMIAKNKKAIFLGQTVEFDGSPMYKTLQNVPKNKKLELPIMEDTQMGMSIGLALGGYLPITIYPRMDFLICAINQLVNHLDKFEEMSNGEFKPKIIIRTQRGATGPLYPGVQHCTDYTKAFKKLLKNVNIYKLTTPEMVMPVYKDALKSDKSSLIIEIPKQATKEEVENRK